MSYVNCSPTQTNRSLPPSRFVVKSHANGWTEENKNKELLLLIHHCNNNAVFRAVFHILPIPCPPKFSFHFLTCKYYPWWKPSLCIWTWGTQPHQIKLTVVAIRLPEHMQFSSGNQSQTLFDVSPSPFLVTCGYRIKESRGCKSFGRQFWAPP